VQNITVTAVGHRLNPTPAEGEGPATPVPHITLLVTPEQAERIQLAATSGRPYLVLRAAGDNDPMSTTGITVANLRGDDSDAPLGAQLLARSMFQPTTRPGDLGSSTQPSLASATTQPDDDLHVRTVTLIQGGAVSTVTFQMPDDKGAAGQVSGINAEMKPIN
jgi:pilus assembly protein CpaB